MIFLSILVDLDYPVSLLRLCSYDYNQTFHPPPCSDFSPLYASPLAHSWRSLL